MSTLNIETGRSINHWPHRPEPKIEMSHVADRTPLPNLGAMDTAELNNVLYILLAPLGVNINVD